MNVDHVLLTRFNLPTGGVEARIRASESWLTNRWALFERYCAPSVAAQTSADFDWVIYFDPESPDWLKQAIAPYVEQGLFTAIFRAEVPRDVLVSDLRGVARSGDGMLLTTNVDNDDGLAIDFMQRLRQAVTFDDQRAVYISDGLIKSDDAVYLRRDPHNAFCSVAEPWDAARTCWDDWHIMLGRSMPVVELEGAPGWLQVIHGENVSNRVRGRLVSPSDWRALFPALLDDVSAPPASRIARDRVLVAPVRRLRDAARSTARSAALAVLGKDGMLALKARLRPERSGGAAGRG
ncbi:putative rhamnosyl transferase [Microbacterium aerolatum]|uniref:glycosyltransferase n=1 Tax=Microbacterium aerolatum TaxID=153731 RepID=UPI00384B9FE9